ncbi:PREDICTED: uncharacterized protein LOC107070156 [Polistes dominula]|uniref:Uncharacterized protein LOC107070156 n=1 Tax=Polistes dominula TaxID=743375 RepID=A0ABM1ITN4_POLDO|nr:PREDICTED: uncharacterized protein LOC107070156 [Polistes dominula]
MGKLVPPDGGFGWIIVMSYALNSLAMIPVMQGSGLVFKDLFPLLNINNTEGSTIISVNMAFGMILGLVNGPLLQHFGYRKMAIVGSLLYFVGITLTAFSRTFTLIIITYGLIASLGLTIASSSFSLALNSYFTTKRGRATGWAITMMGLGSIFMPYVTTILLDNYGPQGTLLVLGSYSLHSILASLMLHPIKWHMKRLPSVEESDKHIIEIIEKESHVDTDKQNEVSEDDDTFHDAPLMEEHQRHRRLTVSSVNHDVEGVSIYGFETPLSRQTSETARTVSQEMNLDGWSWINNNELNNKTIFQPNHYWWNSNKSLNSINLSSSLQIFNEDSIYQPLRKNKSFNSMSKISKAKSCQSIPENDIIVPNKNEMTMNDNKVENQNDDICETSKQKSIIIRILKRIVIFYGLDILRDGIYVNIMLGMSIAIFAEINFSLLTPFILADRNLTTNEIAIIMSVIATADLIFRSIAPYVGEWLNLTPRPMYTISLIFLIISRTSLIFTRSLTEVIIVAVGLGIAKGIRSVYMTLVIPSYVPIKDLHYASAIQMTVNGFIMLSAGPLLGVIRDAVGSYTPCIIVINSMSALTVTIWLTELIILRRTKLRSKILQQDLTEEKT